MNPRRSLHLTLAGFILSAIAKPEMTYPEAVTLKSARSSGSADLQ
jgi:hypothetical protein